MANRDVPGTNSRSGSASGKRKSDKDKSDKDKSEKSRASCSKYADWGAKSPEGQPPPENPLQRTPAGPKPGAFTNAQPPTGGQSGPPQDPPAGSTDPAPPLPTDPPAPQPPLPTGIPPPGNPTPNRNMNFSDVCLFVCAISLTSGQLVSELFPDCTRSCFSQAVSRRRGGDRIYEMRCLFVAVGPNARFIVLPHWDNMS